VHPGQEAGTWRRMARDRPGRVADRQRRHDQPPAQTPWTRV